MGTLLQLAVAPQQLLLLYWPGRDLPSPDGAGTWGAFLANLLLILLAALCGFALGWLYFRLFRGLKQNAPNPGDLEFEIGNLKTEADGVSSEVDKLYRIAGITPQPSASDRGIKLAGVGVDERRASLLNIKQQIADLRSKIEKVRPWLVAAPTSRSGAKSDSMHSPAHKPADAGGDISDMEFSRSNPAARESSSETPTIGGPYYQEAKKARPIGHGEKAASRPSVPEVGQEIVEIYNRAVNDPFERERLRERYTAVRVGTVNAVERRQNPTIEPEYREASDGDFFAYPIGRDVYLVVPSLGLTIEAVGYTAGAVGKVFGRTQGYDPQRFYSSYRVLQPAYLRCEGDRWKLISPGELELGPGD